jgi:ubiquinone/menaquinone biosynthesis C-methylase UbiE
LGDIFNSVRRYVKLRISDKYAILKSRDKQTIDLPSHTVEENRYVWNRYDWSQKGEEWTNDADHPNEWKRNLLEKMMIHYFKPHSVILEIGPGAGRWSEHLQKIAKHLVLVDITPACIKICKERFVSHSNIEYHVLRDNIDFMPDKSIDFIWSYDVFVHINPSDVARYVQNFGRILKSGGIAIIHHSSSYDSEESATRGFRSKMTTEKFAELVSKNKMRILEQNKDLVHKKGDVISVFTRD